MPVIRFKRGISPPPVLADGEPAWTTDTHQFYIGQGGTNYAFQPLDADLTSLAAASATNAIYYRSAANTWTTVTVGTGLTFTGGTLSASGGGGSGTVTSVGLSMPAEFSVAGSPVTTSGTLAVTKASQAQNAVYAGPTSGSGPPTFRALAGSDVPVQMSCAADTSGVKLVGDLANPGINKYYGTDGSGLRNWLTLPA